MVDYTKKWRAKKKEKKKSGLCNVVGFFTAKQMTLVGSFVSVNLRGLATFGSSCFTRSSTCIYFILCLN